MCGTNDAVCLHGDCIVEAENGAAFERCRCYAMYDGAQCSFRKEMLYWELPMAIGLMLVLLGVGLFVTGRTIEWLRFPQAKHDTFAFPRKLKTMTNQSLGARLLRGKWSGPARKGLPTKPAKQHIIENVFVVITVFMELVQWGGFVAAGSFTLVVFCITSSVITIQLNCEASPPEPTLWTHVRYTRVAQVLKAPVAMSVVGSMNANALLLSASCILTSLTLGIMNAKMRPCVLSLVNGLRLTGAIMALWTSLIALAVSVIDDPGASIMFEVWSLGAIAISTISLPGLFLYHTEHFWLRLVSTAKEVGSSSLAGVTKDAKGPKSGKVADSTPVVAVPANTPTAKVAAVGFRAGLPKIVPGRRSSAAEKLRSRSKRGKLADTAEQP
ncbi:hypothetical protein PF006_g1556 [Phytophthora fragariae]|uniref:Uncharacterized protein n=1 Tax=Phytophthora fragariae TaxID=53985 RepID=A0A6A3URE4_9STRA|nr:hypothetical protein PF006_g1556 [Phytophthora fragariae]